MSEFKCILHLIFLTSSFNLELEDNEWPLTTIDHDRLIARAIVVDDEENYYFVRANREVPVLKRAKVLLDGLNN